MSDSKPARLTLTPKEIGDKAEAFIKFQFSEGFTNANIKVTYDELSGKNDRGIDFTVEFVKRASDKTLIKFNGQNKGVQFTDGLKTITKPTNPNFGKISFQLDKIRHMSYYLHEIGEPLIIFLCDLESREIYWYAIQLDPGIRERHQEQLNKGVDSIQLYIDKDNILKPDNLDALIEDIVQSKLLQNAYFDDPRTDLSESTTFELKDEYPTQLLSLAAAISTFGAFRVVPTHVLTSIYPFRLSPESRAYCTNTTINTYNDSLIEEFKALKIHLSSDGNLSKEQENIFQFLSNNHIHRITGSTPRKTYYLNEFPKIEPKERCACAGCSIQVMDYLTALDTETSRETDPTNLRVSLKDGVAYLHLGLFEEAIAKTLETYKTSRLQKKWGLCFIALFNLQKMLRIIRRAEKGSTLETLLIELKKINFAAETKYCRSLANVEVESIMLWMNNDHFIAESTRKLEEYITKAKSHFLSDQYGNWFSNGEYYEFIYSYSRILSFIELNQIVLEDFESFRNLTRLTFDGVLAMYAIRNESSDRLNYIEEYVLIRLIKYLNPKDIVTILRKYRLENITLHSNAHQECLVLNCITNLVQSKKVILSKLANEEGHVNYHFRTKLTRILDNSLIVFANFKYSNEVIQSYFSQMLDLITSDNAFGLTSQYFDQFVSKRHKELSASIKLRLLKHIISREDLWRQIKMQPIVQSLIDDEEQTEVLALLDEFITSVNRKNSKELFEDNFEVVLSLYPFYITKSQALCKSIVEESLSRKFNPYMYYAAVVDEIINYKPLFDIYIKAVPLKEGQGSMRKFFFNENDTHNIRLNQLIHICYSLELPIPSTIEAPSEYYKWLFDLEAYDYSHFNPYWLLEFQVTTYFEQFKKVPQLVEAVRQYLLVNTVDGLQKIFLYHFT